MNETPERIREALEWLYGDTWALNSEDPLEYADSSGSREVCFDHKCAPVWFIDWACDIGTPIKAELQHALAVTAPWGWTGPQKKVCNIPNTTGRANVAVGDPHEGDYQWYLDLDGGKLSMDGECESLEMAKKTARAAYLTWMRGRFAMKGGVA